MLMWAGVSRGICSRAGERSASSSEPAWVTAGLFLSHFLLLSLATIVQHFCHLKYVIPETIFKKCAISASAHGVCLASFEHVYGFVCWTHRKLCYTPPAVA